MSGRRIEPGVLLEKKLVRFPELRDALLFNGAYCWLPIGVQLAFEIYRWMLTSADERGARWTATDRYAHRRYPDILASIGGDGVGCVNVTSVAPFGWRWKQDLSNRLLNALRHEGVVGRWRREQRIDPDGVRRIPVLVYDSPLGAHGRGVGEAGVEKAVDALFALCSPERRLRTQLNSSHPDARRVTAVGLYVSEGLWVASMSYGYDGSSWDSSYVHSIGARRRGADPLCAVQRAGEPFYDFIVRARHHLERVLTPGCDYRRHASCRSPNCNGNWTGITPEGVEYVGGCDLREHVGMWKVLWKASGIDAGPVLLKGERLPRTVEERDGTRLVNSDRSWPLSRELGPDEYIEGRVRFMLRLQAYRRAYLDLRREDRSMVDKFIAPGRNGFGSGPREREEAFRYLDDVRPVPFEEWCAAGAEARCEP